MSAFFTPLNFVCKCFGGFSKFFFCQLRLGIARTELCKNQLFQRIELVHSFGVLNEDSSVGCTALYFTGYILQLLTLLLFETIVLVFLYRLHRLIDAHHR
jgi:hypothetical protein